MKKVYRSIMCVINNCSTGRLISYTIRFFKKDSNGSNVINVLISMMEMDYYACVRSGVINNGN